MRRVWPSLAATEGSGHPVWIGRWGRDVRYVRWMRSNHPSWSTSRVLPGLALICVVLALPLGGAGAAGVEPGIDADGFIRTWWVAAPLPFPHIETGTTELAAKQIPTEATMKPLAGQYVRFPDRELVWLEHQATEPAIDFAKFANEGRSLESLGYAVAYVVSDRVRDDLSLKMGSSKQAKVYVNGKEVLSHSAPRSYKADEDVAPLRLNKGINPIVFKVVNTGGAWRGSLRIVGRGDASEVQSLRVAFHTRLDAADLFPLDSEGYIRNFLLLAPIAYVPPTVGKGVVSRPLVPGEATLSPREGQILKAGALALPWKAVRASEFFLDLAEAAGKGEHRAVAAFAVAYVRADEDMTGLKLKSGSNDQGRVYLNGKAVVTYDAPRGMRRDQDVATGITLKKGINTIVFKVLNTERKWQACLRFTDAQDRPVTKLAAVFAP